MDIHWLLSLLGSDKTVLDLGCGHGSFAYETCPGRIIALDLQLPEGGRRAATNRVQYISGNSSALPLATGSVDVVFCHHTLEHFHDYKATLSEIVRVLSPTGWVWIAVPNGYGFDDTLYRFVFEGGGHVNRFRQDALVREVEQMGLKLAQTCDLFSGFAYLKKPSDEEVRYFPQKARVLARLPEDYTDAGTLAINTATRVVDKLLGTRTSRYGWGFLFARGPMAIDRLPSYFNVCRQCGSGIPVEATSAREGPSMLGLQFYRCPCCAKRNIFVQPPIGLQ